MDSFVGGVLGVLTVGTSLLDGLRKFADCLDFIQKQVGPASSKDGAANARARETSFKDVIRAIKILVDKTMSGRPAAAPLPAPLEPPPPPRAAPAPAADELQIGGRYGYLARGK